MYISCTTTTTYISKLCLAVNEKIHTVLYLNYGNVTCILLIYLNIISINSERICSHLKKSQERRCNGCIIVYFVGTNVSPFPVVCDMVEDRPIGITIVGHDNEDQVSLIICWLYASCNLTCTHKEATV